MATTAIDLKTAAPVDDRESASGKSVPRMRRPSRTTMASFVLLIALLAVWEFGVRIFHVPKFLLPPFSDVVLAMYAGLATGPFATDGFWLHTMVTLWEIFLGFTIGSSIGLLLAIVISEFETLETLLNPYVAALQSLPKVAVAPIIVTWMGFGIASKVVIVCLITFFPVLVTSLAGFKAIDLDRIDLLRSLSASRWQIFSKAKFPSALPYVFAGLDMAAAFSVVGAIVGEFVGAQSGLGVMILQKEGQLDTAGSFAVFIILSLLGIGLTSSLRWVRRRTLAWMPADTSHQTVSA